MYYAVSDPVSVAGHPIYSRSNDENTSSAHSLFSYAVPRGILRWRHALPKIEPALLLPTRIGHLMPLPKIDPHTVAKHNLLRRYIQGWFPILMRAGFPELVLVDGFAGPGRYESDSPGTLGPEGSPLVAVRTIIDHKASTELQRHGRKIDLFFVEKDREHYAELENEIKTLRNELTIPSNVIVHTEFGTFEDNYPSLLSHIDSFQLRGAPTLLFLDPFGPDGIPLSLLARIHKDLGKPELIINWAYQSLNQRFVEDPTKANVTNGLYGGNEWEKVRSITDPREREKFLLALYESKLNEIGWRTNSFRMINQNNQPQYHLIYGTENHVGMYVMKSAAWSVDPTGTFMFSDRSAPNQSQFFVGHNDEVFSQSLADELGERYLGQTITKEALVEHTNWHKRCLPRHLTSALRKLRDDGLIDARFPDGSTPNRGFPKGSLISFSTQTRMIT